MMLRLFWGMGLSQVLLTVPGGGREQKEAQPGTRCSPHSLMSTAKGKGRVSPSRSPWHPGPLEFAALDEIYLEQRPEARQRWWAELHRHKRL